jgi:hypothetical protein
VHPGRTARAVYVPAGCRAAGLRSGRAGGDGGAAGGGVRAAAGPAGGDLLDQPRAAVPPRVGLGDGCGGRDAHGAGTGRAGRGAGEHAGGGAGAWAGPVAGRDACFLVDADECSAGRRVQAQAADGPCPKAGIVGPVESASHLVRARVRLGQEPADRGRRQAQAPFAQLSGEQCLRPANPRRPAASGLRLPKCPQLLRSRASPG